MSLRGIGGPAQSGVPTTGMLVLIDGHPQYMGLFGHPISDAYQSLMAERVEVLRGPASVLYGSNAMGGVVNIVTRKMREDGVKNYLHTGYGSYNTLQSELTNRIRKGTLHERRQRLLQPDRRASGEHGLRAVRRLCQAGL